jgi:hypothetical protein
MHTIFELTHQTLIPFPPRESPLYPPLPTPLSDIRPCPMVDDLDRSKTPRDLIKSVVFKQKILDPKDHDKQHIIALKKMVSIFSAVDDDLFSQCSINQQVNTCY